MIASAQIMRQVTEAMTTYSCIAGVRERIESDVLGPVQSVTLRFHWQRILGVTSVKGPVTVFAPCRYCYRYTWAWAIEIFVI